MIDPEDGDLEDIEVEPDNPDDWREYAEDHESLADERAAAENVPEV